MDQQCLADAFVTGVDFFFLGVVVGTVGALASCLVALWLIDAALSRLWRIKRRAA